MLTFLPPSVSSARPDIVLHICFCNDSIDFVFFLLLTDAEPELRVTEPDENGSHSGRDVVLCQFEVDGVNEEKDYELCVEITQYCYAKKAR